MVTGMAEAVEAPVATTDSGRSVPWRWLAVVIGLGFGVGAVYLLFAPFSGDAGGSCGSLSSPSEVIYYTPPHDGGCEGAWHLQMALFSIAVALAAVLIVTGLVLAIRRARRDRQSV
jgi:hypothetical protein